MYKCRICYLKTVQESAKGLNVQNFPPPLTHRFKFKYWERVMIVLSKYL